MRVRSFAIEDYPAVREIWVASGLDIRPGDELEGVKLKLTRDPGLFLVAEDGGKVVGTAMGAWDGRRGWIYHLGVHPSSQRKGVATRLITELERRMKKLGIPKVNALIYPWNAASVAFFTRAGYEVEEMREAQKWLSGPSSRKRVRTPPRRR